MSVRTPCQFSMLVQQLQDRLVREREKTSSSSLPRSTQINGRYVIDKKYFPDFEDMNSELSKVLQWKWGMRGKAAPIPSAEELDELLPVLKPDPAMLASPPTDAVQVTWLGHASCIVQWEGWAVLADPIFSERCSPMQCIGPKRLRKSPIQVDGLPPIDAVVISHNHYDHLDTNTVLALVQAQPSAIFFVPLGMKDWFEEVIGSENAHARVLEMDWSETVTLTDQELKGKLKNTEGQERPPLTMACVPCQHWCKRTVTDTNRCLWCSWICKTPRFSYFFGGDTGYCGGIFRAAGALHGPVRLSAIPIGAYGVPAEQWFHKANHMNPDEAVKCHLDLNSAQSVAVHWGTFLLTGEHIMEPPQKLAEALRKRSLDESSFVCMQHGEVRVFDHLFQDASDAAQTEK